MSDSATNKTHTVEDVRAVKTTAQTTFARLAKVAGIGVTRIGKGYGLKVNLQSPPKAETVLPTEIGGVPVRVEVVGVVKKRAT